MDTPRVVFGLLLCACVCYGIPARDTGKVFDVEASNDGNFSVSVNGVTWLNSGPTFFNNDGRRYCSHMGNLQLQSFSTVSGYDKFGQYRTKLFLYRAGSLLVETSVKIYVRGDAPPVAVFSQTYKTQAKNTRGENSDDVISGFPSFRLPSDVAEPKLGYLSFGNDMTGWVSLALGKWDQVSANFSTGIQGGPIVLFDKGSNAMVISPASEFMAASSRKFKEHSHLSWGIMGLVDEVPKNYEVSFVVAFSDRGVNDAMRKWGNYLTTKHNKKADVKNNDLTLNYLGYWTDNGAYYYYNTEPGKTYEDTVVDVVNSLKKDNIPITYLQIDSWFYPKGHVQGTRTWVAEQKIFPNGFKGLYEKTGLPIACHNRYWDNDTTYASYNGGPYRFISDKNSGRAVPDDPNFWADLFKSTNEWGKFIMYEQDWMDEETDKNVVLLSNTSIGRDWLRQMGDGAAKYNITIQYCMAYSRHVLQSLEIPQVTQARVSDDYQPGNQQWKIGLTSMFTYAINLGSSKDTFWTRSHEPGNRYSKFEKNPHIQTLIATLSDGPVGFGDGIGFVDKSLLMKCCDSSGKILRASRPLTAMDKSIKQAAFEGTDENGRGEVLYATVSRVSGKLQATVVAFGLVNDYTIRPTDVDVELETGVYQTYIFNAEPNPDGDYDVRKWGETFPLTVGPKTCGKTLCVFHTVDGQYWSSGAVGVLGELAKFSPRSPQRFTSITYHDEGDIATTTTLTVQPGETVRVTFMIDRNRNISTTSANCDNTRGSGETIFSAVVDTEGNARCTIQDTSLYYV